MSVRDLFTTPTMAILYLQLYVCEKCFCFCVLSKNNIPKKKFNNNDNIAEVVEMCLDTDEQDGRRVVLCVCVLLFFSCE